MHLLLYQEPTTFSRTCIPLTVEMSDLLEVEMTGDDSWHDHDRLLVALDPSSRSFVENFYERNGPSLNEVKTTEELKFYDMLLLQKLIDWVEKKYPGMLERAGVE